MLADLGRLTVLMHPDPTTRGIELTSDATDSSQSIILDQVENGVVVRLTALFLLAQL